MRIYQCLWSAVLAIAWTAAASCTGETVSAALPDSVPTFVFQRDLTAPLAELEKELAPMVRTIYRHPSFRLKDSLNRIFIGRMMTILQRPESYDYPFDSLKSVSRLFPGDGAFRIFSWGLTDRDSLNTYRYTYYHGLVQRLFIRPDKQKKIIVIRLTDRQVKPQDLESLILTQRDWLGGIYYQPKNTTSGILTFKGKVGRVSPLKGKRKMVPVKYYILLGINEDDIESNYKFTEVITLDPVDSFKVTFGAPIFYYNGYPLCRKIFRYSDNSPFSLNFREVELRSQQRILPGKKREKMIVFDHLARPDEKAIRAGKLYSTGTDGTQDAFYFNRKRFREQRKGFFIWVRNVTVHVPETAKYSPEDVKKQAGAERRRIRQSIRR